MRYCESFASLLGKTPILRLKNFEKLENLNAKVLAKLEFYNPAGSIKDRVAQFMVDDAQKEGKIKPETTIIEPTSGNTGIGLAAICAARKYKLILTMPETMSEERKKLLKAYGAELVLTKAKKGMQGAIEKAEELLKTIPESFMPNQFSNPSNPKAHKLTTGPEIWSQTEENVDILVAGVGTGGTITGVGEFLKSKNKKIKIVAVEPSSCAVLSKKSSGPHKIQGIGAGFVPKILNEKIYDEIITVKDEQAFDMTNTIAKKEGLLVGISSGAALFAAFVLAKRKENFSKNIVAILPDGGERYLSANVFVN